MLINGMLQKSEAWSDLRLEDVKLLEDVPIPIRFIIASRRLNYFYKIIKRKDDELVKRIFEAQKIKTTRGDWIELIKDDFKLIREIFDEDKFKSMSKYQVKKFIKSKIKVATFNYLKALQKSHSKIKFIEYKKLETQPDILSELFSNEEVKLLFSLRLRMTKVKMNFSKNNDNILCKFGCSSDENQKHLLECDFLLSKLEDKTIHAEIEYCDIFKTIKEQVEITKIYRNIFKIREEILFMSGIS